MRKRTVQALVVLSIVGMAVGMGGAFINAGNEDYTTHRYEIKTEQVQDTSTVNESEVITQEDLRMGNIHNGSSVLHSAWKQGDHFMGTGGATHVEYNYERDTITGWRIVSVDGVYMLVGVEYEGEDERSKLSTEEFVFWLILIASMFALMVSWDHYDDKYRT